MTWIHPDLSRIARRRLPPLPANGPVAEFAVAALAGGPVSVILGASLAGVNSVGGPDLAAGLAVYAAGAFGAAALMYRGYPHEKAGLCNLVTLARLVLATAMIPSLLVGTGGHWGLFAVAAVALSLDGVDGWLARRQGFASKFGARFDMEVDSLLALVLALMAWTGGSAVAAVVLLGLPRYLFGAAGLALPWLRQELPERFSRKAVCVLQLGTLIFLQLPFVTPAISAVPVLIAAGALAWSFARDVAALWRATRA